MYKDLKILTKNHYHLVLEQNILEKFIKSSKIDFSMKYSKANLSKPFITTVKIYLLGG